jgi:hypothetical protein
MLRERGRRKGLPHLWNDFIVTKLSVFIRRSVCLDCVGTKKKLASINLDRDSTREGEFTKEGHDVPLSLSLLKSFALEFDKFSGEFVDPVPVLS